MKENRFISEARKAADEGNLPALRRYWREARTFLSADSPTLEEVMVIYLGALG